MIGKRWSGACLAWAALVVVACAGPSRAHKLELNAKIAAKDWAGAEAQLEAGKDSQYGDNNSVLFWLDKAAVLHDAGRFQESDALLDLAEQKLDALYTQSISRAAGTFFVNDNTDEYRGEPHERALLHVLRALNYAYQDQNEGAVVEARKVSEFLTELGDKLGAKDVYRGDAFAEYLAALLFEDGGRADDARISIASAREHYGWYTERYGTPEPILDPGVGTPGDGELVLLHYNGVAPRRVSQTIQVAWNDAMAVVNASAQDEDNAEAKNALVAGVSADAVTVAFPAQIQDPFRVRASEIEVDGVKARTVLMEDIAAISTKALEDRNAAIRARAVARATLKFIAAKVAEETTKQQLGQGWGMLAGMVARAASAATEVADTRCWGTLPAEIRMARLRLPAGHHLVNVSYLDENGAVVGVETLEVDTKPGKRTWAHVRSAI
ncbi:hypothetical protein [Anaeromyxobacter diazotrophicus]|uniref:Lipoprotein n=1 Tax=Anaeromyxobacter diazotrophicus TaxID=2590199 RepID=A0A7I9VKG4_9BACT|nr:hypothetical protein [Anaeromyxobacter diazotrophicus]GEJ56883.1 hypothetical protein AMYX_16240 [Anaeromyxobacter diazotrophicus]